MKKNNGFTIIELLSVLVVLGIIMAIAVPTYNGYVKKARINTCKSYEKTLEGSAKSFITECINRNKCADDKTVEYYIGKTVESSTLISNNYMKEMKNPYASDNCTGNVKVSKENDSYVYKAYLKCNPGYETGK